MLKGTVQAAPPLYVRATKLPGSRSYAIARYFVCETIVDMQSPAADTHVKWCIFPAKFPTKPEFPALSASIPVHKAHRLVAAGRGISCSKSFL
jgi:hypothetical protein